MIISHKHKFIFIKTFKTAGTSLEIALSKFCGDEDIITPIGWRDEKIRKELGYRGPQNYEKLLSEYTLKDWDRLIIKRRKAMKYYNHIPANEIKHKLPSSIWNNYFKFSFERNPWDRMISFYFWETRNLETKPKIIDFINTLPPHFLSNFYLYSINDKIVVDRVCLYERLNQELDKISKIIGLPENIKMPKQQAKGKYRKTNNHYRQILTDQEKQAIEKLSYKEINYFGYSY